MKAQCVIVGTNHSKDIFKIYHGRPEPLYLCGYHEQKHGKRLDLVVPQKGDKKTLDTVNT